MTCTSLRNWTLAAAAATSLASGAALAHHGWNWAEAGQTEIAGAIQDIYIGPPHPRLRVQTSDGVWTVELGNPSQTERAGFRPGVTKEGAKVQVLGQRSLDASEKRIKAIRVTIDGRNFDFYPERLKPR